MVCYSSHSICFHHFVSLDVPPSFVTLESVAIIPCWTHSAATNRHLVLSSIDICFTIDHKWLLLRALIRMHCINSSHVMGKENSDLWMLILTTNFYFLPVGWWWDGVVTLDLKKECHKFIFSFERLWFYPLRITLPFHIDLHEGDDSGVIWLRI